MATVDNHCTAAILEFLLIGEFQILEMNVNNYMFQWDQTGVGHFFWKISPWTETFPFWFDKNFWKSKYNFPHTLTFVVQFDRLVTCLQAKNTDNCLFDSLNLSFSKKGASTLEARYLLSTSDSFYLILLISLFTSKQGFVLTTGNRTRDLSHRRPHSNPMCQSCAT